MEAGKVVAAGLVQQDGGVEADSSSMAFTPMKSYKAEPIVFGPW